MKLASATSPPWCSYEGERANGAILLDLPLGTSTYYFLLGKFLPPTNTEFLSPLVGGATFVWRCLYELPSFGL